MSQHFVYIVTNYTNSVFHIGITANLDISVAIHQSGNFIGSRTKKYRLYKLVWYQIVADLAQAHQIQHQLNHYSQASIHQFITSTNPHFTDKNIPRHHQSVVMSQIHSKYIHPAQA